MPLMTSRNTVFDDMQQNAGEADLYQPESAFVLEAHSQLSMPFQEKAGSRPAVSSTVASTMSFSTVIRRLDTMIPTVSPLWQLLVR
jgi:hypothetical protein